MGSIDCIWDDNPVDVTTEVNFIWSIANRLRGPYKANEYQDVIIPMTIIRRLECALADTKDKVVAQSKKDVNTPSKILCKISGLQFYNTSEYTLKELLNDSEQIAENFKSYLKGFSSNVQSIIVGLEFDKDIKKMDEKNRLYSVVKAFSELDLNPKTVDNIKMGYIFEGLIRKFSQNDTAGEHYTGRDIIKMMVSVLLAEGCDDIKEKGKVITILDQACGTGGMLSTSYNYLKRVNESADIRLFGQENNPSSYAMCVAEMLIKGQDAKNIQEADTMANDCFPETKMRFVIENPPFGQPWGGKDLNEEEANVKREYAKGFNGRWGAGLPSTDDMQLLFVQSAVNKLDDKIGRAAIIEDGSPMFKGGTASGESQIRRWLLEQDLLEAIIALPTDLFYNTGIATYVWILSKNKRAERKGKVQLIDATSFCHKLRKPLGYKRNEFSVEDRTEITKLYSDFKENEFCQIYKNTEFMYREYAVMQPLQRSYAITEERIENMLAKGSLSAIYDEAKINELENKADRSGKEDDTLQKLYNGKPLYDTILSTLQNAISNKKYLAPKDFQPILAKVLNSICDAKLQAKIADGLSEMDKKAEVQYDKKGVIYDKESKDVEIVKYDENIDDYMAREVIPHIPDAKAFFEENLTAKKPIIKTGAEIPFTRYFYKYTKPRASSELAKEFTELEKSVSSAIAELFN